MTKQSKEQYVRGTIVLAAKVLDQGGRNPKDRPVVLLESLADVPEGDPVVGVAVTTQLPRHLPTEYVRLRWARGGHRQTGLNEANAAVCNWLPKVSSDDILRVLGRTSDRELATILENLPAPRSGESLP